MAVRRLAHKVVHATPHFLSTYMRKLGPGGGDGLAQKDGGSPLSGRRDDGTERVLAGIPDQLAGREQLAQGVEAVPAVLCPVCARDQCIITYPGTPCTLAGWADGLATCASSSQPYLRWRISAGPTMSALIIFVLPRSVEEATAVCNC